MNIAISFLIVAVALVAVLLLAVSLGGLERRARSDVERARSLPPAFSYSPGTASRDSADGDGWAYTPVAAPGTPVTNADLDALPEPARRYFRHAGVVGRQRIASFSVILDGRIRNGPGEPWMPLVMRQFNRLDNPARVVFLSSAKPPMNGIDSFLEGRGRMLIKAANLIKVVDSKGPEMAVSAFVTFLNDLTVCPLAYFSLPIRWRQVGPDGVELSMAHAGMTVSAVMTMDAEGRPVDWKTGDRYAEVKGRILKDRWSTPFEGAKEISGLRVPERGAGVHDYDGTPYVYVELDGIHDLVLDAKGLPDRT